MSARKAGRLGSFGVLGGAVAAIAVYAAAATAGGPPPSVRVANTPKHPELVKTIPITRGTGSPRVVMSLSPGALGALQPGDRLLSTSEVEVSVCLKPNPRHPGSGRRKCIGKRYGYDPKVQAQLVLAESQGAAGGAGTTPISRVEKLKCKQKLPARNHHCVLVIDDGRFNVTTPNELPCPLNACRVNLVMTASSKKAKKGHKLVIGSDSSGRVVQDKGAIKVARLRPGNAPTPDPLVGGRSVKKLKIAAGNKPPKKKVIASVRIGNAQAGETLIVDGEGIAKIGKHKYNAFMTSTLVLGENPTSTKNNTRPNLTAQLGKISKGNGFNCTQKRSAHKNPCKAEKVGVLEFLQDSSSAVYVNLVSGMQAQFPDEKHRKGDKARISKNTFLNVLRFGP